MMKYFVLTRIKNLALVCGFLWGICSTALVHAQGYEDVVVSGVELRLIMGGSTIVGVGSKAGGLCGQAIGVTMMHANSGLSSPDSEYKNSRSRGTNPSCGQLAPYGNSSVMVFYDLQRKEDNEWMVGWVADYRIEAVCPAGGEPNDSGQCVKRIYDFESCTTKNPVNPGSGEKQFFETDYQGAGAHPLEFSRLYRSNFRGLPRIANGWTHNWQRSIEVVSQASAVGSTATVQRTDGKHTAYKYNGTSWVAMTNGRFDVLTEIKNGTVRKGWQLKIWENDSVEHYSAEGLLLKIVQRNGWTNTIAYSVASTPKNIAPIPGLPITITNHFGRKLQLRYNEIGQLINLIDPAGGEIEYAYDASLNLTNVTWQDKTVKQYLYAQPDTGRLTGVIDEMGVRVGTFSYDNLGRVLSSEKANGAEKLTFLYNADKSTSITDYTPPANGVGAPTATTRTHRFGYAQGVVRPVSVTAPCPVCGNTASSYVYDAKGNITQRTEHDGTVTKFAYDAKNREVSRVEAAGTAAAKTYTTQWHATWNLPVLRTEPLKITAYIYDAKGNLTGQAETPTTDVTGAKGAAGVRDVAKPINSTGWTYSSQSLQTRAIRNAQTKNAQGVWTNVVESDFVSTFDMLGNLLGSVDGVNNIASNVTSYNLQGSANSLILNNTTLANVQYNPRAKLATANIGGAVVTVVRDNAQRITSVSFSNINRYFTYSYDQGKNLTQIADNWGNKLIFTFVNGVRTEAYVHAQASLGSALSLKWLDPAYVDTLIRADALSFMQSFSLLVAEQLPIGSSISAYFGSFLYVSAASKNYYGQSVAKGTSFGFVGDAHAQFGGGYGKNPLKCGDTCDEGYEANSKYCRTLKNSKSRAICWAGAAAVYAACIARKL